jgi:hypothetical protein
VLLVPLTLRDIPHGLARTRQRFRCLEGGNRFIRSLTALASNLQIIIRCPVRFGSFADPHRTVLCLLYLRKQTSQCVGGREVL